MKKRSGKNSSMAIKPKNVMAIELWSSKYRQQIVPNKKKDVKSDIDTVD